MWWLRSANNNNNFNNVNSSGNNNNNNATNSRGVALGFTPGRQSNPFKETRKYGAVFMDVVKSVLSGEKERITFLGNQVNNCSDRSGRTLLAWRRLMVMRRFMPSDLIRLYVTIRQPDGALSIKGCAEG